MELCREVQSPVCRLDKIDDDVLAVSVNNSYSWKTIPTGYSLKLLDITVKKKLHKKVNLIPVIAKSETLTNEEIKNFKRKILAYILHQEIDIFAPPQHENIDTEPVTETHEIMSKVPLQMW
ncbi:Septin-domain-containing protein [Yarrowia lipolytica]|uniref:Septin-domain-containing protein n=1 Tax=Yarrowia lipolytica TaxID=4952 RepID=A0A371BZR7_YARLL|nr:Septin-domain-containing protein [Yarrowia lipolytica]RDW35118.1 Septin-domain-containing protein [Yarrowia lipolytica]